MQLLLQLLFQTFEAEIEEEMVNIVVISDIHEIEETTSKRPMIKDKDICIV